MSEKGEDVLVIFACGMCQWRQVHAATVWKVVGCHGRVATAAVATMVMVGATMGHAGGWLVSQWTGEGQRLAC